MKREKITKIKLWVTTAKRNTKPVSTRITIPIADHDMAVKFATQIGQKFKEFEHYILQSIHRDQPTTQQEK